ncbi:uncharacterized protein [Nicotiana sylvestris]|uniref:uncharacterized protein n=1 Tax=Nicotiana sylvestris TaxID=4096 RepID=UPI00388C92BE
MRQMCRQKVDLRLTIVKVVATRGRLEIDSMGLDKEFKRLFWERSDEVVRSISPAKRLFIGGDFNGHIGLTPSYYGEVHGSFGFGDRSRGSTSLYDLAKAFELVIANSSLLNTKSDTIVLQT